MSVPFEKAQAAGSKRNCFRKLKVALRAAGRPPIVKIPMYGDWLGFKHSYLGWHFLEVGSFP